jgi:hypothetical protein
MVMLKTINSRPRIRETVVRCIRGSFACLSSGLEKRKSDLKEALYISDMLFIHYENNDVISAFDHSVAVGNKNLAIP